MEVDPKVTRSRTRASSISTLVASAAETYADRTAVRCGDLEMSYAQLEERCRRLGEALRRLGVTPGERVAVLADNCHRYLELYLGVPAAGMVLVPLNSRLSEREVRHALEDSGTRILFTDRPGSSYGVTEETLLPDDYEGLLGGGSGEDFGRNDADTVAGLFYTSGTTGKAKGTILTQGNLLANARTWQAVWPFDERTRWMLAAPMFHLAGTNAVLATIAGGGRQVVLPRFEAGSALDLVAAERITGTLVVPTMLAAMADKQRERPRDISSLVHLSHGGAPTARETLRRAHRAFPGADLMNIYGTTETAPNVTFLMHEQELLDDPALASCGQTVVGVEVAVLDQEGKALETGQIGEVAVRGPVVMRGYWNRPDATAEALRDGWYMTGDLGRLDEQGHLYLVDRRKDMIVSGGENVYSVEVEDVLYEHPNVLEAAVFGIPDKRWGEAVHAVVSLRDPRQDPEELRAFCRTRIAAFKVPKGIDVVEELPKSGAGKILKRELRERFWNGHIDQVAGA